MSDSGIIWAATLPRHCPRDRRSRSGTSQFSLVGILRSFAQQSFVHLPQDAMPQKTFWPSAYCSATYLSGHLHTAVPQMFLAICNAKKLQRNNNLLAIYLLQCHESFWPSAYCSATKLSIFILQRHKCLWPFALQYDSRASKHFLAICVLQCHKHARMDLFMFEPQSRAR
jgi:hypothetical protein